MTLAILRVKLIPHLAYFSGNPSCSNSEKMDELHLPEGFNPEFQPKYLFILLLKTVLLNANTN